MATYYFNPDKEHTPKLENFLIENGADVNQKADDGTTPIMRLFVDPDTIEKYDPIAALMVLIKHQGDASLQDKEKETALHKACKKGSTISALTLINSGANPETQDCIGNTALAYALKNEREDLCIFLVNQNSKINIQVNHLDQNPENELVKLNNYLADAHKNKVLLKELEKYTEMVGLSLEKRMKEGFSKIDQKSPLYYAIENNMHGIIYLLMSKGFNNFIALSEALELKKFNIFQQLLDSVKKNTVKQKCKDTGKTLFHIFAEYTVDSSGDGAKEVFDILVKEDVPMWEKDNAGKYPLHYACINENDHLIRLLLESADKDAFKYLNESDKDGQTSFVLYYRSKVIRKERDVETDCKTYKNMWREFIGKNTSRLNMNYVFKRSCVKGKPFELFFNKGEK